MVRMPLLALLLITLAQVAPDAGSCQIVCEPDPGRWRFEPRPPSPLVKPGESAFEAQPCQRCCPNEGGEPRCTVWPCLTGVTLLAADGAVVTPPMLRENPDCQKSCEVEPVGCDCSTREGGVLALGEPACIAQRCVVCQPGTAGPVCAPALHRVHLRVERGDGGVGDVLGTAQDETADGCEGRLLVPAFARGSRGPGPHSLPPGNYRLADAYGRASVHGSLSVAARTLEARVAALHSELQQPQCRDRACEGLVEDVMRDALWRRRADLFVLLVPRLEVERLSWLLHYVGAEVLRSRDAALVPTLVDAARAVTKRYPKVPDASCVLLGEAWDERAWELIDALRRAGTPPACVLAHEFGGEGGLVLGGVYGRPLTGQNAHRETPAPTRLWLAALRGDVRAVRERLAAGDSPDALVELPGYMDSRFSALSVARATKRRELISLLEEKEALEPCSVMATTARPLRLSTGGPPGKRTFPAGTRLAIVSRKGRAFTVSTEGYEGTAGPKDLLAELPAGIEEAAVPLSEGPYDRPRPVRLRPPLRVHGCHGYFQLVLDASGRSGWVPGPGIPP
jgi:hypothetical protein